MPNRLKKKTRRIKIELTNKSSRIDDSSENRLIMLLNSFYFFSVCLVPYCEKKQCENELFDRSSEK